MQLVTLYMFSRVHAARMMTTCNIVNMTLDDDDDHAIRE